MRQFDDFRKIKLLNRAVQAVHATTLTAGTTKHEEFITNLK
jgi:hypothetical protein